MAVTRRWVIAAAIVLPVGVPIRVHAQNAEARFVEMAYASALFQERISSLAAAKDTQPGIKALAERIHNFRAAQLPELVRLAGTFGVQLHDTLDLELRSIIENIEPLDSLALSRRYAEIETQALDKEIAAYEAAVRAGPQPVRDYAAATLEILRHLGKAARSELAAVGP